MAEDHRICSGFLLLPFKDSEPTIMNPIDTIKQEYSRVKTRPFKHDGKPVKNLLSCV